MAYFIRIFTSKETIVVRFLVLLFLLSLSSLGKSVTVTAVASGDWTSAATWDLGVPGCYTEIIIPEDIVVTISSTIDLTACPGMVIHIHGSLFFQTGKKLKLPCGSAVIIYDTGFMGVGGGGGSSTYLEMCGVTLWDASMGDIDGGVVGFTYLPIFLVDFEAKMLDGRTQITWTTKSEAYNDYFTVQRSADGVNWLAIEYVDGEYASSVEKNYEIYDEKPLLGLNY